MGDFIVNICVFAAFLFLLGIGGIIADYVLPRIAARIPRLQRYIDSLPLCSTDYLDDTKSDELYSLSALTKRIFRRANVRNNVMDADYTVVEEDIK